MKRLIQKALLLPVKYEAMRMRRALRTDVKHAREIWDEIERLDAKKHEMQRKNDKNEVIKIESKIEALHWVCQEQKEYNQ